MTSNHAPTWLERALSMAFRVLVTAVMLRIAWNLVRPLVPVITVVIVLTGVALAVVRHSRTRW